MSLNEDGKTAQARLLTALAGLADRLAAPQADVDADRRPGEDKLSSQRLYETWLKREEWSVLTEALPLLFGIAPEHWSDRLSRAQAVKEAEAVRDAVHSAVEQDEAFELTDRSGALDAWMVRPQALHTWAHAADFRLPEAFDTLMSFIAKVMFKPMSMPAEPSATLAKNSDRELVLGAALAVVATFPEQCRGQAGWIEAEAVAKVIQAKSAIWFEGPPHLSQSEMAELIDKWFRTL